MIAPIFPSPQELQPALSKLEGHPGSVVLVAVEQPKTCNFAKVTWGWFSAKERKALKIALMRAKAKRDKLCAQQARGDLGASFEYQHSGERL